MLGSATGVGALAPYPLPIERGAGAGFEGYPGAPTPKGAFTLSGI